LEGGDEGDDCAGDIGCYHEQELNRVDEVEENVACFVEHFGGVVVKWWMVG